MWESYWGYLHSTATALVWVGELGTGNRSLDVSDTKAGSQGQWFNGLVRYLSENPEMSWAYWALNEEDSDGLLGR